MRFFVQSYAKIPPYLFLLDKGKFIMKLEASKQDSKLSINLSSNQASKQKFNFFLDYI